MPQSVLSDLTMLKFYHRSVVSQDQKIHLLFLHSNVLYFQLTTPRSMTITMDQPEMPFYLILRNVDLSSLRWSISITCLETLDTKRFVDLPTLSICYPPSWFPIMSLPLEPLQTMLRRLAWTFLFLPSPGRLSAMLILWLYMTMSKWGPTR